jgi:hypothetical protein
MVFLLKNYVNPSVFVFALAMLGGTAFATTSSAGMSINDLLSIFALIVVIVLIGGAAFLLLTGKKGARKGHLAHRA